MMKYEYRRLNGSTPLVVAVTELPHPFFHTLLYPTRRVHEAKRLAELRNIGVSKQPLHELKSYQVFYSKQIPTWVRHVLVLCMILIAKNATNYIKVQDPH